MVYIAAFILNQFRTGLDIFLNQFHLNYLNIRSDSEVKLMIFMIQKQFQSILMYLFNNL